MATVADIMDADPVTVRPDASLDEVVALLRRDDLHGVPVVNDGGRCIGIITEADLVIGDEQGDLHLPHYFELFGGVVFLEPLRRFEERLQKAGRLQRRAAHDEGPRDRRAGRHGAGGRADHRPGGPQPPAGGRARAARRLVTRLDVLAHLAPRRRVTRRAVATIDPAAIAANAGAAARELRPGRSCAPVVKAGGYGHGAARAARAALRGGADWLAVATSGEALELRASGLRDERILVMGALSPEELVEAARARADVVRGTGRSWTACPRAWAST
jgi:hypothetical protein